MFQVYVWHTKTIQAHSKSEPLIWKKYGLNSSLFQDVWLIFFQFLLSSQLQNRLLPIEPVHEISNNVAFWHV